MKRGNRLEVPEIERTGAGRLWGDAQSRRREASQGRDAGRETLTAAALIDRRRIGSEFSLDLALAKVWRRWRRRPFGRTELSDAPDALE